MSTFCLAVRMEVPGACLARLVWVSLVTQSRSCSPASHFRATDVITISRSSTSPRSTRKPAQSRQRRRLTSLQRRPVMAMSSSTSTSGRVSIHPPQDHCIVDGARAGRPSTNFRRTTGPADSITGTPLPSTVAVAVIGRKHLATPYRCDHQLA
jgi:hypothetical protein